MEAHVHYYLVRVAQTGLLGVIMLLQLTVIKIIPWLFCLLPKLFFCSFLRFLCDQDVVSKSGKTNYFNQRDALRDGSGFA